jgi:hypothetical protein
MGIDSFVPLSRIEKEEKQRETERNHATEAEVALLHHLGAAWNMFHDLPVQHVSDRDEFCQMTHLLQNMVAARATYRALKMLKD